MDYNCFMIGYIQTLYCKLFTKKNASLQFNFFSIENIVKYMLSKTELLILVINIEITY